MLSGYSVIPLPPELCWKTTQLMWSWWRLCGWSSVCHNTPLQLLNMVSCHCSVIGSSTSQPHLKQLFHWIMVMARARWQSMYLGGPEAQPFTDPDLKSGVVWRVGARNTADMILGEATANVPGLGTHLRIPVYSSKLRLWPKREWCVSCILKTFFFKRQEVN